MARRVGVDVLSTCLFLKDLPCSFDGSWKVPRGALMAWSTSMNISMIACSATRMVDVRKLNSTTCLVDVLVLDGGIRVVDAYVREVQDGPKFLSTSP